MSSENKKCCVTGQRKVCETNFVKRAPPWKREINVILSVSNFFSSYIYHLICYFFFMAGLQNHNRSIK